MKKASQGQLSQFSSVAVETGLKQFIDATQQP